MSILDYWICEPLSRTTICSAAWRFWLRKLLFLDPNMTKSAAYHLGGAKSAAAWVRFLPPNSHMASSATCRSEYLTLQFLAKHADYPYLNHRSSWMRHIQFFDCSRTKALDNQPGSHHQFLRRQYHLQPKTIASIQVE